MYKQALPYDPRKEARKILKACQRGITSDIIKLKEYIEIYGISYEVLGTSKREVEKFVRKERISKAEWYLKMCREGHFNYLTALKHSLLARGVSYKALGITPEDIRNLNRRERIDDALKHITRARAAGCGWLLGYIHEWVEKGFTSYGELATTKEELDRLIECIPKKEREAEKRAAEEKAEQEREVRLERMVRRGRKRKVAT